jgi:uncharacterized membrane protein
MYPNSALSAGQLALIAVVAVLCVAFWLGSVFVAAREPRRRNASAGTASAPLHPAGVEEPQRKAA